MSRGVTSRDVTWKLRYYHQHLPIRIQHEGPLSNGDIRHYKKPCSNYVLGYCPRSCRASFDFLWSSDTFMLIDISFLKARFSRCKRFPKMNCIWMRSSRQKEMNKEMKEACRSFHTFYRNIFLTAVLHIMPASAWHHGPSAHGWT